MKKIKPGYYILLAVALFFLYRHFFDDSKEINYYTKEVNSILTDLKHQDYFALHSKLSKNLKKSVSVEDIKLFTKSVELDNKYKFIFKDYKKIDNKIEVTGTVLSKSKELPLDILLQENNGTLKILNQQIGTSEIKAKNLDFPIVVNSSNSTKISNSNNSTK